MDAVTAELVELLTSLHVEIRAAVLFTFSLVFALFALGSFF